MLNYTYVNHTLESTVIFEQDKHYIIGAQCTSGCSGIPLADSLYIAKTDTRGNKGDWLYDMNFQGDDGFLYTSCGGSIKPEVDALFVFKRATFSILECDDGVDNDGDGFTDLSDPSCSDVLDDSEAPFDNTECNDGVDNDFDGFIDLLDPRCDSATDNSESPSDAPNQPDNVCLEEEFCLLNEQFPYTDNITNHQWSGDTTTFEVEEIYGSNKLLFGSGNFNFSIDLQNENTYGILEAWYDIFPEIGEVFDFTNNTFYIIYRDEDGKEVIRQKWLLRRNTSLDPNVIQASLFNYNGNNYTHVLTYIPLEEESSRVRVQLHSIDQTLKTYKINTFRTGNPIVDDSTEYSFSNILSGDVDSFGIAYNGYDPTKMETHIDNIQIFGADVSFDTICDDFSLPFYLKESFFGYLRVCGWVTSSNIYADNFLFITESSESFFAKKDLVPTAFDSDTRYVTLKYDLNIENVSTDGTITFRLYDDDDFNFFTVYHRDSGDDLWYNEGGTGKVALSGVTLGEVINYYYVVDLKTDTFDIYVNDSLLLADIGFTDEFANIKEIKTFKISSNNAQLTLDNLEIYGSDSEGVAQLPDDETTFQLQGDGTQICGLFVDEPGNCVDDEDCATGKCMPYSNHCSSFDWTKCDEAEKERDQFCLYTEVIDCGLENTTDWILSNFLYVLVIIILLILSVYVYILFRR